MIIIMDWVQTLLIYYVKKFSKDNITFLTKRYFSLKKFNEFDIIIASL